MYAAGVVVECMLRAFRHQDIEHEAHHDVARHFSVCDADRLGDEARKRLRGPVATVHLLWLNNFRYSWQDQIWKFLDLRLTPFERTRVVFIVTDTPEEYDALRKAAG
jgi:hypothetical protein